jgi:cytoskeletal protein RodZ|tara:strand:- start:1025 stop:1273 length:249 start_codon:yes stop_codon:yes gene_type:complete
MMQDKTELSKKIEELTALRKSIALDLKVIAKSTNIPTQILKNIELQEFNKLPPHPIRGSFIKQYSFVIEKESKKPKYSKASR